MATTQRPPSEPRPTTAPAGRVRAWHALREAEVLAAIGSGRDGLTAGEAARRLAASGPNALSEAAPIRPLRILAAQFTGLIIWTLFAAAAISWAVGERTDALAILAIVLLNGLLGFHQEYDAEKAIAALKRMTAPRARVRRDGAVLELAAREVVPGDLLVLEAGDRVAADARLLEAAALAAVEAALTGESEAVRKRAEPVADAAAALGDRRSMLYAGTSVVAGSGLAVVVATGMSTELGRIAGLLVQAGGEPPTPLQVQIDKLGRSLVWACLGLVALIGVLGLLRGLPAFELFLTAVSLAVAAVPEGLPAVVTIALALGVRRMARRRSLIRKLPAVETLGMTNVIATDKTGTLTVGEMTVRELWLLGAPRITIHGEGYAPIGAVEADGRPLDPALAARATTLVGTFAGCVNAALRPVGSGWEAVGDPTEAALVAVAGKVAPDAAVPPRLKEYPFDPERKRMTAVCGAPGGPARALVKGAPDVLLARCEQVLDAGGARPMTAADRAAIAAANEEMAGRALRVLAAAYRDLPPGAWADDDPEAVEHGLVFVGMAGMQDPPRPEAREAVARCRAAGIRVVMITGDHPRTAAAIAHELGILDRNDAELADAGTMGAGTGGAGAGGAGTGGAGTGGAGADGAGTGGAGTGGAGAGGAGADGAGAGGAVMTGAELDATDDAELARRAPGIAVYARVSAAHKLRIVRAWQAQGAVIAMTGDGVNDAPAIKGADVGIAMGRSGTEVTKEASDMVVVDDNFASIVAAVEEGRGVYANIKKTLQYLLAGNAAELLFIAACIAGGLPMPLLPIHILWINLVTDGLPALALATDRLDPSAMRRSPRPRGAELTDRSFLATLAVTGALTAAVTLGVYLHALATVGEALARTAAFAVLVYAELLRSFGARSETQTLWTLPPHSNLRLLATVGVALLLQPWSLHYAPIQTFFAVVPLGWRDCLALLAVGALPLVALELRKVWRAWRSGGARPAERAADVKR